MDHLPPQPDNFAPTTATPTSVNRPLRIRPAHVIALLLLLGAAAVMVSFFERIPMEGTTFALDWKSLYMGLQGGNIVYRGGSVMVAPWSLPAILPLGFFSMRAGWGFLAVYTITVLILSVPRRRDHMLAMLVLVLSFPALRLIIDGNLEAVVIAGAALVVYGFRRDHLLALVVGILLATAKPQETWILMFVLGVYLLRSWSLQRVFELAMSVAIVVIVWPIVAERDGKYRSATGNGARYDSVGGNGTTWNRTSIPGCYLGSIFDCHAYCRVTQ
jgi:hypothetical protein